MKKAWYYIRFVLLLIAFPFMWLWKLSEPIRNDWFLMLSERRLHKAKWTAYEYHLRDNGRRYLVLEMSYKPGHYLVMNRDQIIANQKTGFFSDRGKFTDFLNESKYYTPSHVNFRITKNPFERKGISLITSIIFLVIVFSGVMVWVKYFNN